MSECPKESKYFWVSTPLQWLGRREAGPRRRTREPGRGHTGAGDLRGGGPDGAKRRTKVPSDPRKCTVERSRGTHIHSNRVKCPSPGPGEESWIWKTELLE